MTAEHVLPTGSAERKRFPLCSGLLDYFPDALAAVAEVSLVGNEKHNPGQPLHWSREKSADHPDCVARHLMERGRFDTIILPDGRTYAIRHSAEMAWRALAVLQEELEAAGAALSRGSSREEPRAQPADEQCLLHEIAGWSDVMRGATTQAAVDLRDVRVDEGGYAAVPLVGGTR